MRECTTADCPRSEDTCRSAKPARQRIIVERFSVDSIEATLRQRGLRFRPDLNNSNESVHLTDPDGYDLQLVNEKVTSSI